MKRREIRHYNRDLQLCRPTRTSFVTVQTITTQTIHKLDHMDMLSYSIKRKAWISSRPNIIKTFSRQRDLFQWMEEQQKKISA